MKKSIWLLSLLLTVTLYSGCDKKDGPASNNGGTTNAYPSPSGTPTPVPAPSPVNYNAANNNTPTGVDPVPPFETTPTPRPTPAPKPSGPMVMCSCYDLETKKLLWKRRLRKSECERLCPLDYPDYLKP